MSRTADIGRRDQLDGLLGSNFQTPAAEKRQTGTNRSSGQDEAYKLTT